MFKMHWIALDIISCDSILIRGWTILEKEKTLAQSFMTLKNYLYWSGRLANILLFTLRVTVCRKTPVKATQQYSRLQGLTDELTNENFPKQRISKFPMQRSLTTRFWWQAIPVLSYFRLQSEFMWRLHWKRWLILYHGTAILFHSIPAPISLFIKQPHASWKSTTLIKCRKSTLQDVNIHSWEGCLHQIPSIKAQVTL